MRSESVLRNLVLVGSMLLVACAPRLYQRETLELKHPDLDQFSIHYESFEGCLWKRDVPVGYRLQRPQYLMTLDVHFGDAGNTASFDLGLTGKGDLSARFEELSKAPPSSAIEGGVRYRIEAGSVRNGSLVLHVLRDGEELGVEAIRVERKSCRALSFGEKT